MKSWRISYTVFWCVFPHPIPPTSTPIFLPTQLPVLIYTDKLTTHGWVPVASWSTDQLCTIKDNWLPLPTATKSSLASGLRAHLTLSMLAFCTAWTCSRLSMLPYCSASLRTNTNALVCTESRFLQVIHCLCSSNHTSVKRLINFKWEIHSKYIFQNIPQMWIPGLNPSMPCKLLLVICSVYYILVLQTDYTSHLPLCYMCATILGSQKESSGLQ